MGCTSTKFNDYKYPRRHWPTFLYDPPLFKPVNPINQNELDMLRETFWKNIDSKAKDNDKSPWKIIKDACKAILDENIEGAISILDHSSIRPINGSMSLCDDHEGNKYNVPLYCFCQPTELISTNNDKLNNDNQNDCIKIECNNNAIILSVRIGPPGVDIELNTLSSKNSFSQLMSQIETKLIIDGSKYGKNYRQRLFLSGKEINKNEKLEDYPQIYNKLKSDNDLFKSNKKQKIMLQDFLVPI